METKDLQTLFDLSNVLKDNVNKAISAFRDSVEELLIQAMKKKNLHDLDINELNINKIIYHNKKYTFEKVEMLILRNDKIYLDFFLYNNDDDTPIIDEFSKLDYYDLLKILNEIKK